MRTSPSCFAFVLALSAISGNILFAQSTTAQITGTISDATGAGVPLAKVTVAGDVTGVNRQTTTADAGTYTIALLPPGVYRVTVVHEGFKPTTRSGVELQV